VTNHLRQVMRKLDCVSRVQVANRVREVAGSAGGQTVPAG
jgi:DNA-binding CsgD family transcriptional regulator